MGKPSEIAMVAVVRADIVVRAALVVSRQYRKFWGHPPSEDRKIA
jgi:hypothetical protein